VARRLNKVGYEATALEGGFDAWKTGYPTETPQAAAVGENADGP
jgi:rhodanese-related sulfurtransferase